MNVFRFFISLLLLSTVACDTPVTHSVADVSKAAPSLPKGVVQKKRKNGTLASEITYRNEQKNGLAKYYYKDGKLRSEVLFKDDKKHGEAKLYYENGQVYQVTNYVAGKKDGIQKQYRDDGRLMAEVPFRMDWTGLGLVEYTLREKRKKRYPTLVVETIDRTVRDNQYIVRASLSEPMRDVTYYVGDLTSDGFLNDQMVRMASKKEHLEIKYPVPPGTFLMEKLNIVAVGHTVLKNPYVLQKSVNIAVENKGF